MEQAIEIEDVDRVTEEMEIVEIELTEDEAWKMEERRVTQWLYAAKDVYPLMTGYVQHEKAYFIGIYKGTYAGYSGEYDRGIRNEML